MKRIISLLIISLLTLCLFACNEVEEIKVESIELILESTEMKKGEFTKLTVNVYPENATNKEVDIQSDNSSVVSVGDNGFIYGVNVGTCKITVSSKDGSSISTDVQISVTDEPQIIIPDDDIVIGITGSTEVQSGKEITLKANVTGGETNEVSWSIVKGKEFATIDENGKLKANDVDGDKVIEVVATSKDNSEFSSKKIITIISKPVLTAEMFDIFKTDKLSFEGYVSIDLYKIGIGDRLYRTYTTNVKTAMDGVNWYAEYFNGDTGTNSAMYFKNHEGYACQVGVNFLNEEEYVRMVDGDKDVTFTKSGLYNSLKELTIDDFKFNQDTFRYEYSGDDTEILERIIASANPYDFVPVSLSLIIEEGEILGISSISAPDYTISPNYRAIQELIVAINYGDTVEVPSITKYEHKEFHDDLTKAIKNMQELDSYELDMKQIVRSNLSSSYTEDGFTETITNDHCLFAPYVIKYNGRGEEVKNYHENASYGYKKINDNLYNSYVTKVIKESDSSTERLYDYEATRAYELDFKNAKPSFAFASEIFGQYYVDEKEGTTTYYVYDLMCPVASTFYYGVGNDIALYGIFATRGYVSQTESFTPYVVVKDDYIVEAGFYFYLGSLYGVCELTYSKFNEATNEEMSKVEFETRNVPSSWSELTIEVSEDSTSTSEYVTVNALDYLKEFFDDENIEEKMPMFTVPLGDTYGFGLTTIRIPTGSNQAMKSICFYFDVPLGVDYTINKPLNDIEEYLLELGFEKNQYNEFKKGDINVAPVDSSLDLLIYVWKG